MKTSVASVMSMLLATGVGVAIGYWVAGPLERSPAGWPSRPDVSPYRMPLNETARDSAPTVVTLESGPFRWRQVESPDFKVYIANLRAIGCPERTIRDIIGAEVGRMYSARHEALEAPPPNDQNYWEPRQEWGPKVHYERRLKHRELEREQEALMAELLGPSEGGEEQRVPGQVDPSQNPTSADPNRWSPEVQAQVHDIQEKYAHLREQVFLESDGRIYPADANLLQELQTQRLAELSQVLTPEQLREFELREGPIAEQLRHQMEPFHPSEAEFRAIHEVRQAFADQLGIEHFDFDDPDYHRAREQVEQQMNEQLKLALGEERFAEYQQSTEPHYRDLYALGERFELPAESVNEMYDLWRTTEQMVDQVHGNPELEPEQKHQILQDFRGELNSEAQQILGADAYYNYRNRGGEWMRHMFGEEDPDAPPF